MEKSNFINVIISIILMIAGACFLLYALITGEGSGEDIIMMIIGGILILYALIRVFITNKAAKDLS